MSQNNPKYKRLESLLSDARQVDPDPNREVEDQLSKTLKTQIPQSDIKPATPEAEALNSQVVEPEAKTADQQVNQPEAQPLAPEVLSIDRLVESVDSPQVTGPIAMTAAKEASVTSAVRKTVTKIQQPLSAGRKSTDTDITDAPTARQAQLALWTAGIFTILGVVFFIFSAYNVFILQKGHFDASDYLLTPVTIVMVAAGIAGFILIRRGRLVRGLWIIYAVAVVPPILAVLVLGNVFALALAYIVILATILITWVFPESERRKAIIATVVAVLVTIGIDLWNPAFRLRSTTLQNFAPFAIGLAVIGLVVFFVRQAAIGSIRTKLITGFVLMALLSMGTVAYVADRSLRTNLTEKIVDSQALLATTQGFQIGQAVNSQLDKLRGLAVIRTIQAGTEAAGLEIEHPEDVAEIDQLNRKWREALQTNNRNNPLFNQVLYHPLVSQLLKFQEVFPENSEILLTDKKGFTVAATNLPNNYYQADALWWRLAKENGQYIGQPIYNPSTNTIALDMAVPVYSHRYGEFVGILRATVNFDILTDLLVEGLQGKTGYSIIYQPNDQEIKLKANEDGEYEIIQDFASTDLRKLFESPDTNAEISLNGVPVLASYAPVSSYSSILAGERGTALDELGWQVIALREKSEALQPINAQTRNILLVFVVVSALVGGTAVFLSRIITDPIVQLKSVAEKVAQGDLDVRANVSTSDEVGTLATSFNIMTTELKNLVGSLEQRVADRTHDLELASEVGRTVTEKVADLDDMLTTAAELIRSRFGLYYTQVYLTDPNGSLLLLRAGTGEVGKALLKRGHRLTIDYASLNGRAVLDRKPVIVADTLENPNFKPNPLLPKTRSEMAVPLISGERILGVLDMQSEQPESLSETNLPAFEALAGQLAIAIQNSQLFVETEQARAEIESQARRLTRTGWANYMDAIHKPEQTGFVFDQNQVITLTNADITPSPNALALSLPLEITGEPVGAFNVELQDETWTEERKELVQRVARQVTQQIENLRLLETAERYRVDAEKMMGRLTHEGWEQFAEIGLVNASGYVYDQVQVLPLTGDNDMKQTMAQPLLVHDQVIGQLEVDSESISEDSREIIDAVARQLSLQIENLRLLETTQYELAERTRTEQDLMKMRLGMDRATDAVFITDVDGTIIYCNAAFEKVYGWTPEETVGQNPRIIKSGLIPPEQYKKFWGALMNKQVVAGEIMNKTRDGRVIPIEGSNSPIIDSDGKIIGYLAVHRDITERKQAQAALTKRAVQLQTVAQLSTTTSTVLDAVTLLQSVVDRTKDSFGVYHAHIYLVDDELKTLKLAAGAGEVGRKLVDEAHSISIDVEQSLVGRSARERKTVIVNNVREDPGFLANPLLPETRSEMAIPMVVGDRILGVFDIQADSADYFTDEDANIYTTLASQVGVALQNARLYEGQIATVTQLRELDRLKSSFLANMSHELRTPLNSILGFADVMLEELDGPLTDNMQNDLGLIQKNGQHLLHLINDVLDMAKIEAGRMNLNLEKFRVHEILDEVTSITSTLASEKNLSLFIESESDREMEITADRTRLRQVMINLVNNSIKFTEKGKISILAACADDHVLIKVKDTGIGIPTDKLEEVFTEFAQVDSSSTRKAGGTGLGLPISRKLIEMHGGRLWAESSGVDGEGSVFYVELPLEARLTEPAEKLEK